MPVFRQPSGAPPGRYNFLIRFVMKRIARKAGAPTDTSRDYEFTDWSTLDAFVGNAIPAV